LTLTGYTPDEIQQTGFKHIVQRVEANSGAFEILSQFQRGQLERLKTEFQADYLIRTTSGELRWIGDHSFPWHDGGGNVIGTVGILIDIHGRKHTEEMLREK